MSPSFALWNVLKHSTSDGQCSQSPTCPLGTLTSIFPEELSIGPHPHFLLSTPGPPDSMRGFVSTFQNERPQSPPSHPKPPSRSQVRPFHFVPMPGTMPCKRAYPPSQDLRKASLRHLGPEVWVGFQGGHLPKTPCFVAGTPVPTPSSVDRSRRPVSFPVNSSHGGSSERAESSLPPCSSFAQRALSTHLCPSACSSRVLSASFSPILTPPCHPPCPSPSWRHFSEPLPFVPSAGRNPAQLPQQALGAWPQAQGTTLGDPASWCHFL